MPDANKWGKLADSFFDVKTVLGVGSLGTALTSLSLNRRSIKDNEKARKESALELKRAREQNKRLLDTLDKLNSNLERKKLINYNYYMPAEKSKNLPKEQPKEQPKGRRRFLGLFSNNTNSYRQKNYSIQTGSYIGEKDYKNWREGNSSTRESKRIIGSVARIAGSTAGTIVSGSLAGAATGYLTGMVLSGIFNILRTAAERSVFNKSVTSGLVPGDLLKIVEKYYKDSNIKVDPVGKVYDVDKSASNYTVSILSKGSVFAILVYRPSRLELRQLNNILDDYCKKYKNADYASENIEPKEDSYIIELNVIKGTELDFIKSLIDTGIKFNIITKDTNLRNGIGMKAEQKGFSFGTDFLDNSFKGASIGGALGSIASPFFVTAKNAANPTNYEWAKGAAKGAVSGIIVGAALGTLFGIIKNEAISRNRNNTINDRYLPKVTEMLLNRGFLEDKDFTRDPKTADDLKTRICIMVSRYSTDTRISINCSADFKTQQLIDKMINDLGLSRRVSIKKQGSDRFANIEMLKRTKIDEDVNLIKSISEYLMKRHIPIYLVEVG